MVAKVAQEVSKLINSAQFSLPIAIMELQRLMAGVLEDRRLTPAHNQHVIIVDTVNQEWFTLFEKNAVEVLKPVDRTSLSQADFEEFQGVVASIVFPRWHRVASYVKA